MSFKIYNAADREVRELEMKESFEVMVDFIKEKTPTGMPFALMITQMHYDGCFSGFVLSYVVGCETAMYRFTMELDYIRYAGRKVKVR